MDAAEGLRRTGYTERASQRVELMWTDELGRTPPEYYRPPGAPRDGSQGGPEMKGIRSDGQDYPDGTWLTIERDGSGWFVAGLSTHAASGSMLPRA